MILCDNIMPISNYLMLALTTELLQMTMHLTFLILKPMPVSCVDSESIVKEPQARNI